MPDPGYSLEINLTKTKWVLAQPEDVPKAVSFAFEKDVSLELISPIIGTDHIKSWPLKSAEDIKEFLAAPSMMQEAFAEKLIRFKHPGGLMPKKWMPKKVKILAKGNLMAKYFGEDDVGTRNVETSLKLYECGHFYLKQTLPGSGPTPYWTIFEGAWKQTENGLRLQYKIRYSWQTSIKGDKDVSIEAQPPGLETTMAWVGENEYSLNGLIPAIVGEEKFCRVEVVREPDKVGKAETRWNEDLKDWSFSKKEDGESSTAASSEGLRRRPQTEDSKSEGNSSAGSSSATTSAPYKMRTVFADSAPSSSSSSGGNANPSTTPAKPEPQKPKLAAPPPDECGDDEEDTEPMWPLMCGLTIFIMLLALMAWFWWEDRRKKMELENQW